MHIIRDHFVTYFKLTGKTLRDVSAEYHEGVHHTHKIHETKRGFYQRRGLGGTSHVKKNKEALFNSMFSMPGLQNKAICSLESQTKTKSKLLKSALSNYLML